MPYVAPVPVDLQERFQAFAGVDDQAIQWSLDEALLRVDTSWDANDYRLAVMLYAAHILTLDGFGTGGEAQMALQGLSDFTSITSGGLSLSRASGGSELSSTTYGQRFLAMQRRNSTPILVV
jgi:hypothetical protein